MAIAHKSAVLLLLSLIVVLLLLSGCGSSAPDPQPTPAPLSAANVNLIFVVSEDLAYQAPGDINFRTANLTSQGLQRSLLTATFLKQQVLGARNATAIYAVEPMTHLQTASKYPDVVSLWTVQQFAMLNQITLSSTYQGISPYTANSYPLNASYSSESVPSEAAPPFLPCTNCESLDFNDRSGDNETLVSGIVKANVAGFYVFSAPWETVSSLLTKINTTAGYKLALPASYQGPNYIYAISIAPAGHASFVSYNSNLNPPATYPVLPSPPSLGNSPCTAQTFFSITAVGGIGGAVVPAGTNHDETVYMVRHAEAHPTSEWEDGNYVGAGQWRALALPAAVQGKISPNQVYSIDPAQVIPGGQGASGASSWSYVRPALTVEPYAIANKLPYSLVASFALMANDSPQQTANFFFNNNKFNNQTILLAWEHDHIAPTVNALLAGYHGNNQPAPDWPDPDYDTIWTVTLDSHGNLSVDNGKCEGISSAALPKTPPQF